MDEQVEKIKSKLTAEVDLLIGKNIDYNKAVLEEIREALLEQIRPFRFNQSDVNSVLYSRADSFERLCHIMRQNNINEPHALNTLSFYKTIELIQEENRRKQNVR